MNYKAFVYYAAAVVAGLIGAFPFVWGREVPLLDLFDLGIHELGHLLAAPLGRFIHTLAGSLVQIAVPIGLAVYFYYFRSDYIGAGICAAWAGTSAYDVSIYIADAPYQYLPLIGGYHDWAYLLGPGELDAIGAAGTIATVVKAGGALLVVAGVAACLYPPLRAWATEEDLLEPAGSRL